MNYDEFPPIKEKYTPVCLDMTITTPTYQVEVKEEPVAKIEFEPIYITKEVYIEKPKEKKERKKYDFLDYPAHWNDKIKAKYKSYYFRIRQKGKQFSLTFEEFENLLTQNCVFCGANEHITIDRLDSNIGYELFNYQSCCYTCNMMKHTLDSYNFLEHISKVYQHQIKL